MFCPNCDTQLPDEANFCWQCGKMITSADHNQYEYCHIETIRLGWRFLRGIVYCFSAKVSGPNGHYLTKKSKEWNLNQEQKVPLIFEELRQNLIRDGWQPIGKDDKYNFRRQIK